MEEKSRGVMFSVFEKQLLLKLIEKYKDVIEVKETNKIAWLRKNEAFMKIQKEFNKTPGVVRRTAQQLRQCYFNLKKRVARKNTKGVSKVPEQHLPDPLDFINVVLEAPSESNCSFADIVPKQEPPDDDSANATVTTNPTVATITPVTTIPSVATLPSVVYVSSIAQSNNLKFIPQIVKSLPSKPQSGEERSSTATAASSPSPAPETSEQPPRLQPAHASPSQQRTDAVKAAKSIVAENMKIQQEKLKQEREETEHFLRVRLLESQIAVQEKILELLTTNPSSVNLVVSGN